MSEETHIFDSIVNEVEVQTSVHSDPMTDHNYFSKEKSLPKNPKIIRLTAIYNCKICGFTTMKKDVLDNHSTSHDLSKNTTYTSEPGTSCDINKKSPKVNLKFPENNLKSPRNNLKSPRDILECPNGYLKCPHCNFITQNQNALKLHMVRHRHGKAFKCTDCDFYAENVKELIAHNRKVTKAHRKEIEAILML